MFSIALGIWVGFLKQPALPGEAPQIFFSSKKIIKNKNQKKKNRPKSPKLDIPFYRKSYLDTSKKNTIQNSNLLINKSHVGDTYVSHLLAISVFIYFYLFDIFFETYF
jgi:hypothetical protein